MPMQWLQAAHLLLQFLEGHLALLQGIEQSVLPLGCLDVRQLQG